MKPMQSHARVVIVGGGIMGVGLLYHLSEAGWDDCVLIEKAELPQAQPGTLPGNVLTSLLITM
jgi:glycine/D-amino acid oxidase-like deaminating enzyme